MASRIEDYALIGDCQTAALVAREARSTGCASRVSTPAPASPRCWARRSNGRWLLAPAGEIRAVRRRYRGDTLILETEYATDAGAVT